MEWDEYEAVVRDVQQRMGADGLTIERNVLLTDSDGIERQFDVVCRGFLQNVKVLYVTECRHRSRPVDMSQVEAFNQKAQSVNANIKAIYSSKGFRKNALIKARTYGINCYSLCEDGITVDNEKIFGWYNFAKKVVVHFESGTYDLATASETPDGPFRISGMDLIWFLRGCVEKGVKEVAEAQAPEDVFRKLTYTVSIRPKAGSEYFMASIGGSVKRCKLMKAKVRVEPIVKMKFTPLCGIGVYDHHSEAVSLPKGHQMAGAVIDTHNYERIFHDWDDASLDALEQQEMRVFWLSVPPIPKGFDQTKYRVYTRRVAPQAVRADALATQL